MTLLLGSGCAAPTILIEALARRMPEVYDVEILHILTFGDAPYTTEELLDHARHNAFFIGPNVRSAVNRGLADHTPIHLSDIPRLFRERRKHLDLALIQVSPPDAHGFCSLGVSVDVVKAAAECADHVIAEVNPHMPRTLGDSFLHVSRIHAFVQSDRAILELPPAEMSPEARSIGEYLADLVEDGATLQTGIGEIPSALLALLGDKKDLGMHTEMFTESVIPLIESGVINGRRKTLLPGKIVASFCFGTRKLYDYIDNNPLFEFRPTEFTNDPWQIARNEKMVSIGSALEVDLTGQICADSLGDQFFSGFGGQVDFSRGAARSPQGKPIIALTSTAEQGKYSRIVASLRPGAGVVTSRADVHYVVTEYGIAYLHGNSLRERALALINIAHPAFREELLHQARERHLTHPKQIALPEGLVPYPERHECEHDFAKGLSLQIRPIKPTDESLLKELFYSHSEETIIQRYFALIKHLPHERAQQMVTLDFNHEFALVALKKEDSRERMLAVARYARGKKRETAEVAVTVHDDFKGRGIGKFLLKRLMKIARDNGIREFTADVLATNRPMMGLFHKVSEKLESKLDQGVFKVRFPLVE